MEKFKDIFGEWLGKRVDSQIESIDEICAELNIDASGWFFNNYLKSRNVGNYSGYDILNEMQSHFIFFLSNEFQKPLFKYLEPHGKNIYNEPYLGLDLGLEFKSKKGLYFSDKKGFKELKNKLSLSQKEDLMTDKIFGYIINKTNSKLFTKKEQRLLKLKKLNEYNKVIE